MIIRTEQMETFQTAAVRNYEEDVVAHLKEFAPARCEICGDTAVRRFVGLGIERAKTYGMTTRGPVRLYIDLMLTLGADFDSDPQLPWATGVLNDPSLDDQFSRAKSLYEAYQQYRSTVAGPDNKNLVAALRRFRHWKPEEKVNGAYEEAIIARLQTTYPQKAQYLGGVRLEQVVRMARASAESFAIGSYPGVALLSGLMFGFGHGVISDPLYPWVASTLNDSSITDANERVTSLHEKTISYLDRLLETLGS